MAESPGRKERKLVKALDQAEPPTTIELDKCIHEDDVSNEDFQGKMSFKKRVPELCNSSQEKCKQALRGHLEEFVVQLNSGYFYNISDEYIPMMGHPNKEGNVKQGTYGAFVLKQDKDVSFSFLSNVHKELQNIKQEYDQLNGLGTEKHVVWKDFESTCKWLLFGQLITECEKTYQAWRKNREVVIDIIRGAAVGIEDAEKARNEWGITKWLGAHWPLLIFGWIGLLMIAGKGVADAVSSALSEKGNHAEKMQTLEQQCVLADKQVQADKELRDALIIFFRNLENFYQLLQNKSSFEGYMGISLECFRGTKSVNNVNIVTTELSTAITTVSDIAIPVTVTVEVGQIMYNIPSLKRDALPSQAQELITHAETYEEDWKDFSTKYEEFMMNIKREKEEIDRDRFNKEGCQDFLSIIHQQKLLAQASGTKRPRSDEEDMEDIRKRVAQLPYDKNKDTGLRQRKKGKALLEYKSEPLIAAEVDIYLTHKMYGSRHVINLQSIVNYEPYTKHKTTKKEAFQGARIIGQQKVFLKDGELPILKFHAHHGKWVEHKGEKMAGFETNSICLTSESRGQLKGTLSIIDAQTDQTISINESCDVDCHTLSPAQIIHPLIPKHHYLSHLGEKITVDYYVVGNPKPDVHLESEGPAHVVVSGRKVTVVIDEVTMSHIGLYKIISKNCLGSYETCFRLYVQTEDDQVVTQSVEPDICSVRVSWDEVAYLQHPHSSIVLTIPKGSIPKGQSTFVQGQVFTDFDSYSQYLEPHHMFISPIVRYKTKYQGEFLQDLTITLPHCLAPPLDASAVCIFCTKKGKKHKIIHFEVEKNVLHIKVRHFCDTTAQADTRQSSIQCLLSFFVLVVECKTNMLVEIRPKLHVGADSIPEVAQTEIMTSRLIQETITLRPNCVCHQANTRCSVMDGGEVLNDKQSRGISVERAMMHTLPNFIVRNIPKDKEFVILEYEIELVNGAPLKVDPFNLLVRIEEIKEEQKAPKKKVPVDSDQALLKHAQRNLLANTINCTYQEEFSGQVQHGSSNVQHQYQAPATNIGGAGVHIADSLHIGHVGALAMAGGAIHGTATQNMSGQASSEPASVDDPRQS